jgi:hypothetical protein
VRRILVGCAAVLLFTRLNGLLRAHAGARQEEMVASFQVDDAAE